MASTKIHPRLGGHTRSPHSERNEPATGPRISLPGQAMIPGMDPVPIWGCPHGNHYCLCCEDCGRRDPRNGAFEAADWPAYV